MNKENNNKYSELKKNFVDHKVLESKNLKPVQSIFYYNM